MRPQLEAPEPGRSEESHRILRRAQRERLAGGDHRSLQRVAIKCSLGLAQREGPRRVTERGKRESGVAEHGQDVLPEGQGQKWGSSVGKCSWGKGEPHVLAAPEWRVRWEFRVSTTLPSPGQGADWVVGLSPRVEASGPVESQALREQVETLQARQTSCRRAEMAAVGGGYLGSAEQRG